MALAKSSELDTPEYTEDDGFVVRELPQAADESYEEFPEDFDDYYPLGMLEDLKQDRTFKIQSKREDVRGRLATIYTLSTFGIFVLGFVVAVADALVQKTSMVDNLTKILPLISGIFLGSLGFVLGYYFRRAEDEDSQG